MDDLAVGRLTMLARQRKHWRQGDLAVAAGVSQQLVALAEAGALERLSVRALRRIAAPLEIRMLFTPPWNGGEADRLRDRDHASLVEQVTAILQRYAWEVVVEYTFSHYGERGSIDIVAWHPVAHVLLVVEIKTRIYDVQALIAGVDRKARLAGQLLMSERGWMASAVARLVVVPELTANRSLVDRHASVFEAALPAQPRGPHVAASARRPALWPLVSLIYQPRWWYPSRGRAPASTRAWRRVSSRPRLPYHQGGWYMNETRAADSAITNHVGE